MGFTSNAKSEKEKIVAPNLKKRNLVELICSYGVTILSFIFFGYVAIMSVFQTSVIDPANFGGEHILYEKDDLAMNFFLLGAFFLVIFGLRRYANAFLKISDTILMAGLAIYTVTLGFIWIFMVESIPAADSGTVTQTAMEVAKGNYNSFITSNNDFYNNVSYYQLYPFQLGYVFICEIFYRIFGTDSSMIMQVVNVLALTALYMAIIKISKMIFNSKAVTFITIFMLAGCVQAIFFTTFVYGNLIGIASAMWGCYFVIKFMQSEKKNRYLLFIPASLLMALSIIAKYNNMIWLVAVSIGLIIYVIRSKKWLYLVSVAFVCLIAVGSFNLIIYSYESRSGVKLGDGVSQTLYLDAGLNESGMAPGWYNDLSKSNYLTANCDTEEANKIAKEDIELRKAKFKSDPAYTRDFFSKKVLSQWNEPSYESLWVSQVKAHTFGEIEDGSLLQSIYTGGWSKFFYDYFDFFQMISFILFAVGMAALIKKKIGAEAIMIVSGLIGGFLYHLLFEAKSQYVLTYFIIMLLFASYGLYFILKPRTFGGDESSEKKTVGKYITNIIMKIESKTR